MIGDELGMQQHVAIDEHQVVRRCGGYAQISQARGPEPFVRL